MYMPPWCTWERCFFFSFSLFLLPSSPSLVVSSLSSFVFFPLSFSVFFLALSLCLRVTLRCFCVWCVCVCWEREGDRVYVQNASRVFVQNVPVRTCTTPACGNTCRRGTITHGDVLNPHTGFSRATPHQTPQPQWHTPHTHHTHTHTNHHATSHGDRDSLAVYPRLFWTTLTFRADVATIMRVIVTPAVCPRLFEILTRLTFGAQRRKHCVNSIWDRRKKKNRDKEARRPRANEFTFSDTVSPGTSTAIQHLIPGRKTKVELLNQRKHDNVPPGTFGRMVQLIPGRTKKVKLIVIPARKTKVPGQLASAADTQCSTRSRFWVFKISGKVRVLQQSQSALLCGISHMTTLLKATRVVFSRNQTSQASVTSSGPFCDRSCKFVYWP